MASPEFERRPMEFVMKCPKERYSTETKSFTCLVCGHTESMTPEAYKEHASTAQHVTNAKAMTNQIYEKLRRFKVLLELCDPYGCVVSDIRQIRDVKAKTEIEAGLFRFFFSPDKRPSRTEFAPAMQKMFLYEVKEWLVIVALAVWKALCIQNVSMPPTLCSAGSFTDIQEYLQQWSLSGWKANKAAHRNANAIGIVLQAVAPFLSPLDAGILRIRSKLDSSKV